MTSNSRMMYAFSRDADIPSSQFFHKVDKRWHCPIRTGPSIHYFLPKLRNWEALTTFLLFAFRYHQCGSRVR